MPHETPALENAMYQVFNRILCVFCQQLCEIHSHFLGHYAPVFQPCKLNTRPYCLEFHMSPVSFTLIAQGKTLFTIRYKG